MSYGSTFCCQTRSFWLQWLGRNFGYPEFPLVSPSALFSNTSNLNSKTNKFYRVWLPHSTIDYWSVPLIESPSASKHALSPKEHVLFQAAWVSCSLWSQSCVTCTLSMTLIMVDKPKNEHANLTKTRHSVSFIV